MILITIVAYHDYKIWKIYVKTIFLYKILIDDLFMIELEVFVYAKYLNKMCKLQMSIYGLKKHFKAGITALMRKLRSLVFVVI